MEAAFNLAEEIYRSSYLLKEHLAAYNPGICRSSKKKTSLSSINMDAAIICSKLEHLRSFLWEGKKGEG